MLRRPARTVLIALATLGLAVAGVGVAVAGSRGDSVTVTKAGTVIDGEKINGYLHVKANNVTIRNTTLRYSGNHTLRIFSGFTGTVIEDTKIYCEAAKTNGVVFGNYTARRVQLSGCKNGFMYSDSSPAVIVDSTWNGRAISVGTDVGGRPGPAPTKPPTGPSPTASPSPTPSASTSAPAPRPTGTATSTAPPPPGGGSAGIPSSFPGPNNTGVPAGVTLRNSGGITASKDGQVISGLNINGCVTVTAKNVVIRNSRISCGGTYSIRTNGAKNLVVEDVEINGQGKNSAAVCCGDYTLRRVEITNVIDGPRLGSNTRVENSWIHHLTRVSGSHNDVLQTTGASNIVVRGNTLEAYNPSTRDPFNACLMIGSTTGPIVSNLVYEGNYCNGGNYSIGVREDLNAANIVFRNNVYGHNYRFGVIARPKQSGITWDSATNVYVDTRKPVK